VEIKRRPLLDRQQDNDSLPCCTLDEELNRNPDLYSPAEKCAPHAKDPHYM
jgi:hypothetical protein